MTNALFRGGTGNPGHSGTGNPGTAGGTGGTAEFSGGNCMGGNCADCGGCSAGTSGSGCGGNCGGGTLFLTESEIAILRRFGEIPFWPVCRRADGETPVCLEEGMDGADLSALALKGLIRLDYDLPLSNFDYTPYVDCVHHGSMALSALGQAAVEMLEVHGVEAD